MGAITGLKASIIPLFIYALFSSSRLIIVGPDASTAALVGAVITPLAAGNMDQAVNLAAIFALLVGVFLLIGGIARLGFIADFIPKQVLVGFMGALGIMIIISQLGKIFDINISSDNPIATLAEAPWRFSEIHMPSFITALISICVIQACFRWFPMIPGPVVVMILGILAVKIFAIDNLGIKTIGNLPTELPHLFFRELPGKHFLRLYQAPYR